MVQLKEYLTWDLFERRKKKKACIIAMSFYLIVFLLISEFKLDNVILN